MLISANSKAGNSLSPERNTETVIMDYSVLVFRRLAQVLAYSFLNSFIQGNLRLPPKRMCTRGIHQLAVHPVWFGGIPTDFAFKSGRRRDFFSEFLDGDVRTIADIDDFRFAAASLTRSKAYVCRLWLA